MENTLKENKNEQPKNINIRSGCGKLVVTKTNKNWYNGSNPAGAKKISKISKGSEFRKACYIYHFRSPERRVISVID